MLTHMCWEKIINAVNVHKQFEEILEDGIYKGLTKQLGRC